MTTTAWTPPHLSTVEGHWKDADLSHPEAWLNALRILNLAIPVVGRTVVLHQDKDNMFWRDDPETISGDVRGHLLRNNHRGTPLFDGFWIEGHKYINPYKCFYVTLQAVFGGVRWAEFR